MIFRYLLSQSADLCRKETGKGITQVRQDSEESLLVGIGYDPVYSFQDMRVDKQYVAGDQEQSADKWSGLFRVGNAAFEVGGYLLAKSSLSGSPFFIMYSEA